jgi:hypothetical protein
MDTETLFRVIGMLNARIEDNLKDIEFDDPRGSEIEWYWGRRDALTELRDELQKYIDNQVAQMETEQGM